MIRLGCSIICITMAIDTVDANWLESQIRLGKVTFKAIRGGMRTEQRERDLFVDLCDIVYDPVIRCVTSRAICTKKFLVHIDVTRSTFI